MFGYRQQARLDRIQRNRVDQVAQRDARLHLPPEAHQHAFRHVQRHDTGGGAKGHQAGTGREADADRKTRMAVSTGAYGVWQQHAVEPAMDDAVAGAQTDATAGTDEVRQLVVHLDVDRLGISRRVAERLHHQVGTESQAGQVLQFVTCHRSRCVLGADRSHPGLAIGTGTHTLPVRQTHRAAHDFLRQRKAGLGVFGVLRQTEQHADRQAQGFARLGRQTAPDDERNATTRAHLVEQDLALELELGNHLAVLECLALVRAQFDHVAHVHLAHVELDRQGAGVFHRVVENRRDLVAQADTAETFVRHKRDVFAGEPQHRIGGRLAA